MATAVIEAHVVQDQRTATTATASSSSGHSARLIRHAESTEDPSPIGHVVGSLYDKWGTSSLKDYIVDDQVETFTKIFVVFLIAERRSSEHPSVADVRKRTETIEFRHIPNKCAIESDATTAGCYSV